MAEISWVVHTAMNPLSPMAGSPGPMGDNQTATNTCGYRCDCNGQMYGTDYANRPCPRCGKQLKAVSKAEQTAATGSIAQPKYMGASVTFSCGVYKAASNNTVAFGDSPEEALFKLAKGLGDVKVPSIAELNDQLSTAIDTATPETVPEVTPEPAKTEPPVMSPNIKDTSWVPSEPLMEMPVEPPAKPAAKPEVIKDIEGTHNKSEELENKEPTVSAETGVAYEQPLGDGWDPRKQD